MHGFLKINAAKEVSKLIRELQDHSGSSLTATKEMAQHLSDLLSRAETVDKEPICDVASALQT